MLRPAVEALRAEEPPPPPLLAALEVLGTLTPLLTLTLEPEVGALTLGGLVLALSVEPAVLGTGMPPESVPPVPGSAGGASVPGSVAGAEGAGAGGGVGGVGGVGAAGGAGGVAGAGAEGWPNAPAEEISSVIIPTRAVAQTRRAFNGPCIGVTPSRWAPGTGAARQRLGGA